MAHQLDFAMGDLNGIALVRTANEGSSFARWAGNPCRAPEWLLSIVGTQGASRQ